MSEMTAEEAAARLGVKVATVYAYVSRGVLRSFKVEGSRTSRFDAEEVEAVARRGRPRRTSRPQALDLVVETALTSIGDHEVRYRGLEIGELARTAAFEEVAEWLWTGERVGTGSGWEPAPISPLMPVELEAPRDRLRIAVVLASAGDPLRADLSPAAVVARGRSLIATMVGTLASGREGRAARLVLLGSTSPRRGTIAGRLWPRLTTLRPTPGLVSALNAALVLLADHELAASTVAARVAASARADPYAVVLAGLGPLSGSLHGGASIRAYELLASAAATAPEPALARALEAHGHLPGFGHRLYPGIDPRARVLLELLRDASPAHPALVTADRVVAAARRRAGLEPNVDLALALLAQVSRMGPDAGEVIFTLARTAGWLAHGLEEYAEAPLRFRARAVARS